MRGYDEFWKPDPEFAALCAEAERRGFHTELTVSGVFGPKSGGFRNLTQIVVRRPEDNAILARGPIYPNMPGAVGNAAAVARMALKAA